MQPHGRSLARWPLTDSEVTQQSGRGRVGWREENAREEETEGTLRRPAGVEIDFDIKTRRRGRAPFGVKEYEAQAQVCRAGPCVFYVQARAKRNPHKF